MGQIISKVSNDKFRRGYDKTFLKREVAAYEARKREDEILNGQPIVLGEYLKIQEILKEYR